MDSLLFHQIQPNKHNLHLNTTKLKVSSSSRWPSPADYEIWYVSQYSESVYYLWDCITCVSLCFLLEDVWVSVWYHSAQIVRRTLFTPAPYVKILSVGQTLVRINIYVWHWFETIETNSNFTFSSHDGNLYELINIQK